MDKPILFNTEMVKAILDGKKTSTRRPVKRTPSNDEPSGYGFWKEHNERDSRWYIKDYTHNCIWWTLEEYISKYSKYHVGDVIWVRETWTKLFYSDESGYTHYDQPMIYYAADGTPDITLVDGDGFPEENQTIKWKPSIHMHKEAARLFLKVTDVKIERLNDITEHGAEAEGFTSSAKLINEGNDYIGLYAVEYFRNTWDSIYSKQGNGWNKNPWVWVIEFEKVEGR